MKYISLFLLLFVQVSWAQDVLENNPPSVKWYKLKTPNFRILYPKGFEDQAQRVANTLEHIREPEARSLGVKPRKISVVLQNQSAISNGFVSMVPRRSEFYAMPSQNYNFTGTNDWLDLLASHEYRHIVQFQRANTGFNRLLYYVFGPATFSAMAQSAVPQWFWEGDAVVTETAFTQSGRGRIPNFGLLFRTNILEGREFNYHKQYLRSYHHNIPDHYVLGYYMTAYLREKLNSGNSWANITKRTWSVPFIPFAFSNSIKRESGMYVTKLYRTMVSDLKQKWSEEIKALTITPFTKINSREDHTYTDYKYPQLMQDGSVVVMKEGIGNIEQFVSLNGGFENKIFTPGLINETVILSVAKNLIVWNERAFDARWRVKNYSVIKIYNIDTKKLNVVTRKSRYGGAALSEDGTKIVTVETTTDYKNTVVVIDTQGEVLKQFPNTDNSFYSMVRWFGSDQLVALKTNEKGRAVVVFNFESGEEKVLIDYTKENIGHPVLTKSYLFYNSPLSGIDNIYALDVKTKKRFQVTSSKYGAYNPVISKDENMMYYNEQSRNGLDVVKVVLKPTEWKQIGAISPSTDALSSHLAEQENQPDLFKTIPSNQYTSKKYHPITGVINPYSWGAVFNSTFTGAEIGIASQDILSTTSWKAGYFYDIYEKTGGWQAGLSYQRFLPVIDVTAQLSEREDNERAFGNDVKISWTEKNIEGGLRIPLVLTRSKFLRELEIGNYIGVTKTEKFLNEVTYGDSLVYRGSSRAVPLVIRDTVDLEYVYTDRLSNGFLTYNKFYISFYNLQKRSARDFLHRWGQSFDIEYYNTPYETDFTGSLFAFRSVFYFPGFFKHHFLYARYNYQKAENAPDQNIYRFRNRIFKPRGHSYPLDEIFNSFSVNYAFPLWYPDIAIGPLVNIQRIKVNLFYDYGKGTGFQYYYGVKDDAGDLYFGRTDEVYKSMGAEVTFDINIMRALPKIEIGFRYINKTANRYNNAGNVFEFLIGNIGF